MNLVRLAAMLFVCGALALGASSADAYSLVDSLHEPQGQYRAEMEQYRDQLQPDNRVAQDNGGKSLSEAVDQVRRQTNGRILSAETRVSGNREVHHIKVLTKDGKVKTHTVQGRKRGG